MKLHLTFKALIVFVVFTAGGAMVGQTVRFALPQVAGDPTTVADGDLWYNTTSHAARARINGSTVSLGAGLTSPVTAADGGTGQTTPTADNLLVGDGSAWNKKTLPSCSTGATDKLLYDTSTDTFSCGADQSGGGGGGVWSLGASATASSSATIDLVGWYSASCTNYAVHFNQVVPSADAELEARFSTDGGSSWEATGSSYETLIRYWSTTGGSFVTGGPDDHMRIGGNVESTGGTGISGTMWLINAGSTTGYKWIHDQVDYIGDDAAYRTIFGTHTWKSTTAVNGLRFYFNNSANIVSGNFRIYCVSDT